MSLAELTIENLRCLQQTSLNLHPGHNLIWGGNASGKTSLLEAVFLLGRGRSFRTRNSERLIRHGEHRLVVFGRTHDVVPRALGVQVSRPEGTVAKIDGAFVQSLAELSKAFAVQVIEPGIHRLLEEGGHRRRRWMDWAVFHVEPGFIDNWSSYTRSLKQRNAALRTQPSHASAWDPELIRLGEMISESRRSFLERLQPYWAKATSILLAAPVDLTYSRGWVQGHSLAEALLAARERDASRGVTHVGPHRADVVLRMHGRPARDVLSRGQQKLVAIAMTLAQLHLIQDATGTRATLLLDDPAAELDRERLTRFAEQIATLRCQLLVTALSADLNPLGSPQQVFHVEQGTVHAV
jgi:DNA replication and repair protein RecF